MDSRETFFVDFIDNNKKSTDLIDFYEFINQDETTLDLNELLKENKDRYNKISLDVLEDLTDELEEIANEIKKVYSFILPESLKYYDLEIALENKKVLDLLYNHLSQLEKLIKMELSELKKDNNLRQEKIKHIDYSSMDKRILVDVLEKYNNLISFSHTDEDNIYKNYKKELKRKKLLNKIYRTINIELEKDDNEKNLLEPLKIKTTEEIAKIYDRILYLEDLMIEGSQYVNDFSILKKYFSRLIAFDDTKYSEVNKIYNFLTNNNVLKDKLKDFENVFIEEREQSKKEEDFIYEKIGMKNLKISLDYISANYMDEMPNEFKVIVKEIYRDLNKEGMQASDLYLKLKPVTNYIWEKDITDIYSYEEGKDFCFICTNNQFIDEKYQAILITKEMLNRVNDYSRYQIGFICHFNNNILYVTENKDIMEVKHDDMSNLKTPKQIEQEFVNFKVRNNIALNGYITSIKAVYLINDGDFIKYKKALELANQYDLPLIVLKKDK